MVYLSHQYRRECRYFTVSMFPRIKMYFFLFTDISNNENMLLRIFFDNEIPQEEKNIFVRRYLYDCTRLSQSNS